MSARGPGGGGITAAMVERVSADLASPAARRLCLVLMARLMADGQTTATDAEIAAASGVSAGTVRRRVGLPAIEAAGYIERRRVSIPHSRGTRRVITPGPAMAELIDGASSATMAPGSELEAHSATGSALEAHSSSHSPPGATTAPTAPLELR